MSALSQRTNPNRELWLNLVFWRAWVAQGIMAFSIPLLTVFASHLLYKLIPHHENVQIPSFPRRIHASGGGTPEDTAPLALAMCVLAFLFLNLFTLRLTELLATNRFNNIRSAHYTR